MPRVAVVGGGPAGMCAAQVLTIAGCAVDLYEHKASVGRKFLVAGRGGLNLTHSEPAEAFVSRYETELPRWRDLLASFGPSDLRGWAEAFQIETFIGSSGRVFPQGKQAAKLLRRWVECLRELEVTFHVHRRLETLERQKDGSARWVLQLRDTQSGERHEVVADAVVLALGGASWPQTGSDGLWTDSLRALGITLAPWQPANCGFEVNWTPELLAAAEGHPLKNVTLQAGGRRVAGEVLITRYGLEGGALYQLGRTIRALPVRQVEIDLKPALSVEQLLARLKGVAATWPELARVWKLSAAGRALLECQMRAALQQPWELAALAKSLILPLGAPRPIAEAISSAGGVEWSNLNEDLMVRRQPGLFVAGEMIDWEAPTGGYLLQGCFATGTRAAEGVGRYLRL